MGPRTNPCLCTIFFHELTMSGLLFEIPQMCCAPYFRYIASRSKVIYRMEVIIAQSRLYLHSACSFLGIYYCATSQCYHSGGVALDREADQHINVGKLE